MTDNISKLEFEVAEARAKLARDLAFLRSPQTYRKFTAGLKSEAQSVVQRMGADLRARAAANPSAALAIGAGLAWRLLKHPPIATALVGAGVLTAAFGMTAAYLLSLNGSERGRLNAVVAGMFAR